MNKSISRIFALTAMMFLMQSAPVISLAQTPTAEQLELLQQLSPQQRAAALEAYSKQQGAPVKPSQPLTQPEVVQPRDVMGSTTGTGMPFDEPRQMVEQPQQMGEQPQQLGDILLEEGQEVRAVREELPQFGYSLFAGVPTTFAPATDIPVPVDYVIGPGDTVMVQLFGKENVEYSLVVNREGLLNFPGIGPISVAGLSFQELKQNLHQRIAQQMIGIKASISMGPLRSIRIFVLGDAYRPGSYVVSGLSTITNALFVSGGILTIGTLRDIQLKRNGKIVNRLDLYDLLLQGDTSNDVRLLPGDVIFIPPIGMTAGVGGEVRRPAIYELKKEKNVRQLMALAGGILPTAYPQASQLERISAQGERTLVDVDLKTKSGLQKKLRNGDVLRIYSVLEKMEDIVVLSGHVERPGRQQWYPGMRLTNLIPKIEDLLPKPDLSYVIIKREQDPDRTIEVFSANLGRALASPGSRYNVALQPRDEVLVFSISEDRAEAITPIIDHLRQQARYDTPEPVATVEGSVRFPGTYPLAPDMRVSDLIRAARDLLPQTDLAYALLVREVEHGTKIQPYSFRPDRVMGDAQDPQNYRLQPRDTIWLFNEEQDKEEQLLPVLDRLKLQATETEPARLVHLSGVVTDPGLYPLEDRMRISDLLAAGNRLKESAYTLLAELTRYVIVQGKRQEVAHISVDLAKVLAGDASADLFLEAHDHLNIKQLPEWGERLSVEVVGEVNFPGVYPIARGEQLSSLLKRVGGLTDLAFAEGAIFVREELKAKEQQQLNRLADRLESDLAAASVQRTAEDDARVQDALSAAQALVASLRETKATGRMVIDLNEILFSTREGRQTDQDVSLKNGDKILIPQYKQEVSVLGEVFFPTSHLHQKSMDRDDYIHRSGGLTRKADDDLIYVVRANGSVIGGNGGGFGSTWFQRSDNGEIKPGDTIIVPVDFEYIRPLALWTSVSQIIYQLGLAAASANAIGVF